MGIDEGNDNVGETSYGSSNALRIHNFLRRLFGKGDYSPPSSTTDIDLINGSGQEVSGQETSNHEGSNQEAGGQDKPKEWAKKVEEKAKDKPHISCTDNNI